MMGQRLREARINAGLTQIELANLIGVNPAEISQYESDKRTPRWLVFLKIVDSLNISADILLGRVTSIVSEDDDYKIRADKKDLQILEAIRNNQKLYKLLLKDPERNCRVINNNLKEVFPEKFI